MTGHHRSITAATVNFERTVGHLPSPLHANGTSPNMQLTAVLALLTTSLCWGITNPLIKRGSAGLDTISHRLRNDIWIKRRIGELGYLLKRWQFVVPLAVNLSGSALYYITLGNPETDLSVAVPIASAFTLAVTILAGAALGEKIGSSTTILGIALVFGGVMMCTTASTWAGLPVEPPVTPPPK
ncbi:hypothetical protein DFS34DRAFT_263587 [Phlyctochytrium arcticum]|nr:hypothetical protein DFS34DRAFT_263587 [Phlyctochytrium arcticum]